jgi:hypothetical protein
MALAAELADVGDREDPGGLRAWATLSGDAAVEVRQALIGAMTPESVLRRLRADGSAIVSAQASAMTGGLG